MFKYMQQNLKLVLPNKKLFPSYVKGEIEYQKEGTRSARGGIDTPTSPKDFSKYNRMAVAIRTGSAVPKGRVASTVYWAVVGNKVVGRLDLRHKLNKILLKRGGHIGYAVVPSERRKGYATEMLRLGLKKAKCLGIQKVRVGCDEKNIASRKVIEANGGVLIKRYKTKGLWGLNFLINSKP